MLRTAVLLRSWKFKLWNPGSDTSFTPRRAKVLDRFSTPAEYHRAMGPASITLVLGNLQQATHITVDDRDSPTLAVLCFPRVKRDEPRFEIHLILFNRQNLAKAYAGNETDVNVFRATQRPAAAHETTHRTRPAFFGMILCLAVLAHLRPFPAFC